MFGNHFHSEWSANKGNVVYFYPQVLLAMEQQDRLTFYHKVLEIHLYHGALWWISELWEIRNTVEKV